MGLKRVSWVRRYQGQCRALGPLGHQGYRLRNHKKDQPLCSGYKPGAARYDGCWAVKSAVTTIGKLEMPAGLVGPAMRQRRIKGNGHAV